MLLPHRLLAVCATALALGFVVPPATEAIDPIALGRQMIAQTKTIQTLSYTQKKWERKGLTPGDEHYENISIKLQHSPYKLYVQMHAPKTYQILYKAGWNDGEAKIRVNALITANRHPDGDAMRENQHHNIRNAGFRPLAEILEALLNKYQEKANEMATYAGAFTFDGHYCYKVVLENKNFKYVPYTMKGNETILDIAKRKHLSEHMILWKNKGKISEYTEAYPGTTIMIPEDYAKKTEVLIDRDLKLPRKIEIYDDLGAYARYEFYDIKVNPSLPSSTWEPETYGF